MTPSYVPRLNHIWQWLLCVCYDSFKCDMLMCALRLYYYRPCATRPIHMCHDSFICYQPCETWRIHMWQDSFIWAMTGSCVTWPLHVCHDAYMCVMTHSYVPWPSLVWCDRYIKWKNPNVAKKSIILTRETLCTDKRDVLCWQKRPNILTKETYHIKES